ncbi:MAG: non-ribosomal peptide synthetase, partial [Stackebrandtia sp.]
AGEPPHSPILVPTRVREQAGSHPDRVAVIDANGSTGYGELHRHSAAVASSLKRLGLGPEALVAVCLPRDRFLLSALLGVWAADAAFVPLDPDYPAARLEFMLADSGAPAVLTTRELAVRLPIPDSASVLYLEDIDPDTVDDGPPAVIAADRLAYAIYTSGSTGRPKCVQIEHRGLANQIGAFTELLEFTAADRMAGLTSLSFDPALIELFVPLATGGTVVMLDSAAAGDPERLHTLLAAHDITVAQATPSTWKLYTDHTARAPDRLRCVLTGGEVLPSTSAARLLGLGVTVHNVYGPTETTVWATSAPITDSGDISVGTPIPGLRMFIMDIHDRLAPAGTAGELWIAGAGVARSYRGRPDLTGERFVTAPDATRAYRTGDLARWRPDGNLAFLGRIDDQVKIRGHRIELGEIEAVLREHPDIRDCLTAVRSAPGGDGQLVAAVVGTGDDSAREARSWAQRQLPAHMVPSQIVAVSALPLTPSGKGDRKSVAQLAAPPQTAPDHGAPAGEVQRRLHDVWCEVLGVPTVSVNANLFEIGATSLSIVQARQVLLSRHDIDLPLTAFFTHPTIEALAEGGTAADRTAPAGTRGPTRRRTQLDAARRRRRHGTQ